MEFQRQRFSTTVRLGCPSVSDRGILGTIFGSIRIFLQVGCYCDPCWNQALTGSTAYGNSSVKELPLLQFSSAGLGFPTQSACNWLQQELLSHPSFCRSQRPCNAVFFWQLRSERAARFCFSRNSGSMEPRVFVALPTWGVGEWSPRQWRKSAQDSMFHLDRVWENDDK